MKTLLLAALLCACDSTPDRAAVPADATAGTDVSIGPMDAPFSCAAAAPAERAAAPACLALDPQTLAGATPFGNLDVQLVSFSAGDCLTISLATVEWTGSCGERLLLQFPYPVTFDGAKRQVTGSFDADARFDFQPPGWAPRDHVTRVHVDVAQWQEGQDIHDIDITVTVSDPLYVLPPARIHGTFCDWPWLLC